jgi:hypothetical protein
MVTINSRCTTVELALLVDGLLNIVFAQHLLTHFTSFVETSTGGLKSC